MKELQDKAWLEQKYIKENLTMREIGELIGCTKHPVYRALKKHGLQARAHSSKYPKLNDKEWLYKEYVTRKKSAKQISIDLKAPIGTVYSAITHMGIKTRNPKMAWHTKYKTGRWGEEASNWKGGRKLTSGGHMYAYYPQHPYATKEGYIMEHRMVMEEYLGRILHNDYVVHHIDGLKLNNTIENLMLLPNRSAHLQLHFEASREIAYLKDILKLHNIKYDEYQYECLPDNIKNTQNPFNL
jgi:predicted DNA-binding protein YlxM (UPF0122 family)